MVKEKANNNIISEIILVDNGSTDNSVSIAKKLGVNVYSCDGNISQVRNIGASKASSDYFCFVSETDKTASI